MKFYCISYSLCAFESAGNESGSVGGWFPEEGTECCILKGTPAKSLKWTEHLEIEFGLDEHFLVVRQWVMEHCT